MDEYKTNGRYLSGRLDKTMNIAVVPFNDSRDLKDRIFTVHHLFITLKEFYEAQGHVVHTYEFWKDYKDIDVCFIFRRTWKLIYAMKMADVKVVYLAFEPEAVVYEHTQKGIRDLAKICDLILTPFLDVVDGKKILYCAEYKNVDIIEKRIVPYEKKKLLCNISGCKSSRNEKELYSARVDVIKYMKDRPDFDFYGDDGWRVLGYKNFGGACESKFDTYQNYRFALSLENVRDVPGYISEKILDCFVAGIVPVYSGGRGVDRFIPKECYINYFDFACVEDLITYLEQLPREEYDRYLASMEAFLQKGGMEQWGKEEYLRTLPKVLPAIQNSKPASKGKVIFYTVKYTILKILKKNYFRQGI